MASPITWQNVGGPSLAEASRPLDSAARAFDMGFGAIRGVLDQRNTIDTQNYQTGRTNNTNAFLDRLQQYKTVDELRAAQTSGAIDQLRASFGPQIDGAAVRGAIDQRLQGLMTQQKQAGDFQNWQTDFNQAGERDAILADINSGDPARVAAGQQRLAASQLREKAALSLAGNNAAYQQVERGRAAEDQLWQGEAHRDGLASSAVQRQTSLGNLAVNQGQLALGQRGMQLREAEAMSALDSRLQDREAKLMAERAATFKTQASSTAGQSMIDDAISSIKDPDDQKQARIAASEAMRKYPNASTSSIISSIRGIDANWAIDMFERGSAVKRVGDAIKSGAGTAEEAAAEANRERLDALISANQAQRRKIGTPAEAETAAEDAGAATSYYSAEEISAAERSSKEDINVLKARNDAAAAAQRATEAGTPVAPPVVAPVTAPATPGQWGSSTRRPREVPTQREVEQQARSRLIAERRQAEEGASQRKEVERSLAAFNRQIAALEKVTDKNTNKAPMLKRAKEERDRLKELLAE